MKKMIKVGKPGDVRVGYFTTSATARLSFERKCVRQEIIPFKGINDAKERAAKLNQDLVILEMIG